MRHSTKNFSEDLRNRVVKARLSGISVLDVSVAFDVSKDCVYRWVKLFEETGSVLGKQRGGYRKPKVGDMAAFEAFARAHAHSTLSQMRAHWEGEISEMSLSRTLKKLGWTRKKNSTTIANVVSKSEKNS